MTIPAPPPEKAAKEPVLNRAGIVLVSQGVLYIAATLGLSLDPVITGIVVGLAGPVVLGLLARAVAWSPASVRKLFDQYAAPVMNRYVDNQALGSSALNANPTKAVYTNESSAGDPPTERFQNPRSNT